MCWAHLVQFMKEPLGFVKEVPHGQTDELVQDNFKTYPLIEVWAKWWGSAPSVTASIEVVSGGMLVELSHVEPESPVRFGFTQGHKTQRGASISLEKSRKGFVHRLAYLVYLVSMWYKWVLVEGPFGPMWTSSGRQRLGCDL
ncbi:hypothetical protein BJ322DRAFT_1016131 [Thelephora terrestris]|uniref:Uncharacterized protein n=1 Tax=Thelephora terrestris TaxID=56493 RepID=A0A9P6HQB2_9AGAM|nr:hypothetical protein BJ322DRAFT_1016131 [Thelephora terrestris]